MRILKYSAGCLLLTASLLSAQPVTTLSNAELFSRQYVQADTVFEAKARQGFPNQDQNFMPRKRRLKSSSVFKTTLGSAVCGAGSFLIGSLATAGVLYQFEEEGDEWQGLGSAIGGIYIGGTTGVVAGSSLGTYLIGKKYRRGSYWHALAGALVPSLAVAGITAMISKDDNFDPEPTLVTLCFAPITSTAAYFIFADDKPSKIK